MLRSFEKLGGNNSNDLIFRKLKEAVAVNKVALFYEILLKVRNGNPTEFSESLAQLISPKGQSPWHYAAFWGRVDFFVEPLDEEEKKIWLLLKKQWLNHKDQLRNTPLHLAVAYVAGMPAARIKAKKHVVRKLMQMPELILENPNHQEKTALHLAVERGCYETVRELLKVKNKSVTELSEKGKEIASEKETPQRFSDEELTKVSKAAIGYQRTTAAIKFARNPKLSTQKENNIDEETIYKIAEQINIEDKEFSKELKNVTDIAIAKKAIDIRINALRKRHRSDNIKRALLGSIDSAFGSATFVGLPTTILGGPLLGAVVTLVAFPVFYVPLVYTMYKSQSCRSKYDRESAETLYLSWLVAALPRLAQQEYKDLSQIIERSPSQKPKLKLQYITREEFRNKKERGQSDPLESYEYANKTSKAIAVGNFINNVICPAGACLAIGMSGISLVAWGLGYLGVGVLASLLSGPLAPIVFGTVGLLAVGSLIGFVANRAYYNREKADMGQKTRELLLAHDECKRISDLIMTHELQNELSACPLSPRVAYRLRKAWWDCCGLFAKPKPIAEDLVSVELKDYKRPFAQGI